MGVPFPHAHPSTPARSGLSVAESEMEVLHLLISHDMLWRLSLAGPLRATFRSAAAATKVRPAFRPFHSPSTRPQNPMTADGRPVGTRPNDAKTGEKGQPMEPIPSASLVVLCPVVSSTGVTQYATLMVQRSARDGSSFRLAVVFPGGALDLADEDAVQRDRPEGDETEQYHQALRLCALRETFEETGLLLVPADDPSGVKSRAIGPAEAGIQPEEWAKIREEIHNDARAFPPFLSRIAQKVAASSSHKTTALLPPLAPISHHSNWVTPRAVVRPAKRFDAHFFLAVLDKANALGPLTSTTSRAGSEKDGNLLNLSADGTETTSLRLATSEELIELAVRDQIVLFPPQFYILADLAASLRQVSPSNPSVPPLIFRHPTSMRAAIDGKKGVTSVEEEPRGLHPESSYQFEKKPSQSSIGKSVTSVEPCALPSSGVNVSKTTLEWRRGNGVKGAGQIEPNTPAKALDQDRRNDDDDEDEPFVFPLVLPGDHLASLDQQAKMSGSRPSKVPSEHVKPLNRVYVTPRSREDGGGLIVRGARRRNLPGLIDFEEGAQLEEMGLEDVDEEQEDSSSAVRSSKL